jgi:hypothetical protein
MVAPQRYLKVSTMQTSKTLRLILGDQLNSRHSWYSRPQRHVVFAMMEVRQETDYVKHHIQKIVGFFAAMRGFADWLRSRGHRVVYLALDDDDNRQNLEENIIFLLGDQQCECFEYQSPRRISPGPATFCYCSAAAGAASICRYGAFPYGSRRGQEILSRKKTIPHGAFLPASAEKVSNIAVQWKTRWRKMEL